MLPYEFPWNVHYLHLLHPRKLPSTFTFYFCVSFYVLPTTFIEASVNVCQKYDIVVCIGMVCCSFLLCSFVRVLFSFTLNARSAAQSHEIQPGPSPPPSLAHGHTSNRAPRPFCLAFYPDVLTEPRGNKRLFSTRTQAKRVILSPTTNRTASCGMKVLRGFETSRSVWPRPCGALAATSDVWYSARRHVSLLVQPAPRRPPRSTPKSRGQNAKGRPNCKTTPAHARHTLNRHLEQQFQQSFRYIQISRVV